MAKTPKNPTFSNEIANTDRDYTIARIRAALRLRSGKAWSVRGGRGTSYGWIDICARGTDEMSAEQRAELAGLLGLPVVHSQGVSIPAASDYRVEYIDRAEGRTPRKTGVPYWD